MFFLSICVFVGYPNIVATYGRGYTGFSPSYSYQFPGEFVCLSVCLIFLSHYETANCHVFQHYFTCYMHTCEASVWQCVCVCVCVLEVWSWRWAHFVLIWDGHLPADIMSRANGFFFRGCDRFFWWTLVFPQLGLLCTCSFSVVCSF